MSDSDQKQIIDANFKETPKEQIDLEENADDIERAFLDEFEINDSVHEYWARIYRIVSGQKEFVEQVGTDKFPIEERLQRLHNGGHFEAMVFKDGKIWKSKRYRVAPPPEQSNQPIIQNSPITEVSALLENHTRQMREMFQGQALAPREPVDWVKRIPEIVAAIASAKTIFTPPPVKDNTEMFFRMFELAKDLNNSEGGSSNVYDVVRELMKSPLAEKAAEQIADYSAQQKALPQPVVPGAINVQIEENPIPEQVEQALPENLEMLPPQMVEQLRGQILYWTGRAQKNCDPALYADLAFDDYEPELLEYVVGIPNLQEILVYFSPDAAQFMPWFQSLILEIKAGLTQDIEPGDKGNSTGLTQPEEAPVNAPEKQSDDINSAPAANSHGNSKRGSGNKRDTKTNASANKGGKEKPARKATRAKSNTKAKAKRPVGGN